jgi:hypothetical protein
MPQHTKEGEVTPIPFSDCTFTVEANDDGLFVGRCREFPELRSRPVKSRLAALDAIMQTVAKKIRQRDAAQDTIKWVR